MARAFWKGSLSFGLVEIPVSLRPASETDDLQFTLLDRKDFAPVGYRRYNKNTGREVAWDQVVHGYEYEPDEYVVLSDEEIRRANAKTSGTVEIVEFVEAAQIDPALYETPGHQAGVGECSALARFFTIELVGALGFFREIREIRH